MTDMPLGQVLLEAVELLDAYCDMLRDDNLESEVPRAMRVRDLLLVHRARFDLTEEALKASAQRAENMATANAETIRALDTRLHRVEKWLAGHELLEEVQRDQRPAQLEPCNEPGCEHEVYSQGAAGNRCGGILYGTEDDPGWGCGRRFCPEHLVGRAGPFYCRPCWAKRPK